MNIKPMFNLLSLIDFLLPFCAALSFYPSSLHIEDIM